MQCVSHKLTCGGVSHVLGERNDAHLHSHLFQQPPFLVRGADIFRRKVRVKESAWMSVESDDYGFQLALCRSFLQGCNDMLVPGVDSVEVSYHCRILLFRQEISPLVTLWVAEGADAVTLRRLAVLLRVIYKENVRRLEARVAVVLPHTVEHLNVDAVVRLHHPQVA